jgi:hypothetical protein
MGMEDEVRRSIMIALIALLALALAAPLASAQSQGGAPEPLDDTPFLIPGSGSEDPTGAQCTFDVSGFASGSTKVIDVPERPGEEERTISIFPAASYTLTNVDEPENTVTLSTTGTFHQTTLENGDVVTMARGRNLLGDPQAGLVLAIGNFSYVFDAEGNLIQPLQGEGQLIDVCGLLS